MKNDGTSDTGLSTSEQIAALMAGVSGGGSQQKYNPPTRYRPSPGSSFPALKYDGPNLLDSAGNEQSIYDTSDEYAKYVYGSLTPSSRQFVFDVLKDKGFYGGGKVGVFDNDINAIKNMGMLPEGYVINHFLTDTDAFFILTDAPNGLKHFVRASLKTAMEGDFDTGNMRFKARERYSFGFSDPRGIFGTPGAA